MIHPYMVVLLYILYIIFGLNRQFTVNLFIILCGNEVDLLIVDLSYCHIISSSQEFKIDNVLKNIPCVHIPVSEQAIPKPDVYDVVFPKCFQLFFPFDVEPLDLIKHVGFHQGSYVSRYRLICRFSLFCAVFQLFF